MFCVKLEMWEKIFVLCKACQQAPNQDIYSIEGQEQADEKMRIEQQHQRKHLYTEIAFCLSLSCLWSEGLMVIVIYTWIKNVVLEQSS